MKKLVITKSPVELAQTLTMEQLEVVEWPETAVPPTAIQDPTLLVGRVARTEFAVGEPIIEPRLAPKGAGSGLAATIPNGKRAMTVKVSESSGVAGFIHPGDLVDVIATMQIKLSKVDDNEITVSRVVLQRIKVLAVGEELTAPNAKPIKVPVVTLLVLPEESEKLALASSHGELALTMRSGTDEEPTYTAGICPTVLMMDAPLFGRIAEINKVAGGNSGSNNGGGKVATSSNGGSGKSTQTVEIFKGTSNSSVKTFETSREN
jgi:pilus assembly protein CpaB